MTVRLFKAPHYCWEWDGLYVRPWDDEISTCCCRFTLRGWFSFWFQFLAYGDNP